MDPDSLWNSWKNKLLLSAHEGLGTKRLRAITIHGLIKELIMLSMIGGKLLEITGSGLKVKRMIWILVMNFGNPIRINVFMSEIS